MHSQRLFPLTLLLPLALANGPAVPESNIPPKVDPTKLENFTWTNPFSPHHSVQFEPSCEATRTFSALEYQLHDLSEHEPAGLLTYREPLMNVFRGRPYPGGWEGMDAHGYERELLRMEYSEVPIQVREWIENQDRIDGPGKGLFAVFGKPGKGHDAEAEDKITIFAPGALYETLPLWLVQDSGCEGTLIDLRKYSPKAVDGGVVGWPTEHTLPEREEGEREISFTLKAQVLSSEESATENIGQDKVQNAGKDEL
ncbi:unnamed protein product [Discula destructiva]